jgi:hypothetical protein
MTIHRWKVSPRPCVAWRPLSASHEIDPTEIQRPSETAAPTTWEVRLFAGEPSHLTNAVINALKSHTRHAYRVLVVDPTQVQKWAVVYHPRMRLHSCPPGALLPAWEPWELPGVTAVSPVVRTQRGADEALAAMARLPGERREVVFVPEEERIDPVDACRCGSRLLVAGFGEAGERAPRCDACKELRPVPWLVSATDLFIVDSDEAPFSGWAQHLRRQIALTGRRAVMVSREDAARNWPSA